MKYSPLGKLGYFIPRARHVSAITVHVDNGLSMSFLRNANKCLYGWEAGKSKPTVVPLRDRDISQLNAQIEMDKMLCEEDDVIFELDGQPVKGNIVGFGSWDSKLPIQVIVDNNVYNIHSKQIELWSSSIELD